MNSALGDVLPAAAAKFGAKIALIVGDTALSFQRLDELSTRIACALAGLGLRAGDRVSLCAGNCWQWVVAYYGALKAGAIVNPLNSMLTQDELGFAARDCAPRFAMFSREKATAFLDIRKQTPVEHVILFDEAPLTGAITFDDLIARAATGEEFSSRNPKDTASVGYTSGTTGHPKGAMTTHWGVILSAAMYSNMIVRAPSDTVLTAVPLPHVYGTCLLNSCMISGATLIQMPRFDPDAALELAATHRVTMIEGVPTMYMYMLNSTRLSGLDLSSLRVCMVGGQTMPLPKMAEVEHRFGCPLKEIWGMTEVSGVGIMHPFHAPSRLGSIGIPIPFVQCRIADVDDPGSTLPDNADGELMIRSPIVMQGYFRNESATRETIEPDGWMHTGDIARRDSDGFYFVVDRKKDMINTAGFKVWPAEIERVVAAHSSVALVAVGGVPDELKGEIAKAYVVLKSGASPDEESILDLCRKQLAAYKVPRAIQFVADLPKTSSGKIMRRELKKLHAQTQ
jgi:long-chain acyl-CoA synthetase